MYLARAITVRGLIEFGWRQVLVFATLSTIVSFAYLELSESHQSLSLRERDSFAAAGNKQGEGRRVDTLRYRVAANRNW